MIQRAYAYRFYPTPPQETMLRRQIGASRKIWNWGLAVRSTAWKDRQERVTSYDLMLMLTQLKKQHEWAWLTEVSAVPLQQTLRDLDAAFANFFAGRARYPRYKPVATARKCVRYTRSGFTYRNGQLKLAKIMTEPLNIVWSRPLPKGTIPSSVTVSCDKAGRWHISILVETEVRSEETTGAIVGIDLGVKTFAVLSDSETITLPDRISVKEARVRRYQKRFARTQKASANRKKAQVKLSRAHAHVADTRRDFLHKTTTELVRTYDIIVLEDLNIAGLTRRPKPRLSANGKKYVPNGARAKAGLNRALLRAGFAEFRSLLEYKAAWYGKRVIVIDRYHPSSKLCSVCGWKNSELRLSDRTWSCRECGTLLDRDLNAAKNILAAGLVVLEKEREILFGGACGTEVRPQDPVPLDSLTHESVLVAAPVVKQETFILEPVPT